MKKNLVVLILLSISLKSNACSCEWVGNFSRIAKHSGLVIKGKVVQHIYHTENGKRFINHDEFIHETLNNEFDPNYGTGESIKVEILEIIRGEEHRKIIEIFDTDGADCRASIHNFQTGKVYIFATHKSMGTRRKLPNETKDDYQIGACYESTLQYFPEENQVYGMIKGKSYRRKNIKYNYEKLKRKLMQY
ncbi:hypothetical protein SAMN04489761_1061 [Tenacibaculum sp. MAR_2009_124]|uniref:hypothetical protein n=1 Tax=Tenacibaculum sp. MAR_2009_124 TaxID=1250059 RepID=UPI0008953BB7|nr:hypothetical protein [Tenacibaculum sp. MAR_2009_124]SEB49911.1 hypothetical protein SAMN04489761_1061 [Tenacibaculum sp. MAR_2009_124]